MSSSDEESVSSSKQQQQYDNLAALVPPGPPIRAADDKRQQLSSEAAQAEIDRKRIQNGSALVDAGLRIICAVFLGYLLRESLSFQESLVMKVGRGQLNYQAYPDLLNWIVGADFAKVAALALIVVRYLFPSKDTLEDAVSTLRNFPVIGRLFGKAKESSSSNNS